MVKIRLLRMGRHKSPCYRIVVADSKAKANGAYIELLGTYNPLKNEISLKKDEILKWLYNGAQPTETVKAFFSKQGIWAEFINGKISGKRSHVVEKTKKPSKTAKKASTKSTTKAAPKTVSSSKESINDEAKRVLGVSELTPYQLLRYKLWKEQNGIDMYDGSKIDINVIVSGEGLDIDSILANSVCQDKSIENKTLTHTYNNEKKQKDTPYIWLTRENEFANYKARVNKLNISDLKRDYYLYEGDAFAENPDFVKRNSSKTSSKK